MNRRELLRELSRVQATWINRNTTGAGELDITAEQEADYLGRVSEVFERAREQVRRHNRQSRSITAANVIRSLIATHAPDVDDFRYDRNQPRDRKGRWTDRTDVTPSVPKVDVKAPTKTPGKEPGKGGGKAAAPPPPRRVKAAADIGTPSADGKVGRAPKESAMTAEWKAHNDSLTKEQRQAVRTYSTTDYMEINGVLRQPPGAKLTAKQKQFAKQAEILQDAMAPAPRGVKAFRGSNLQSLGLPKDATVDDVKAMLGKTVINDAFTSTSTDPEEIFGGNVEFEIDVPEGTPSVWMNGNARVPSEQELLLAAGSKMKITGVREVPAGSGQYKIKGRIVA